MRDSSTKDAPSKTSIKFLDLHFSTALGSRGEISDGRDIERNILLYTREVLRFQIIYARSAILEIILRQDFAQLFLPETVTRDL